MNIDLFGNFNGTWNSLNGFFASDNEFLIRAHVDYSASTESTWLSVDPSRGTIMSGENENISVIMNASEIFSEGVYDAKLQIFSASSFLIQLMLG